MHGDEELLITLALEDDCESHAFGSVCMSVRTLNSKTIGPIDLIFFTFIKSSIPVAQFSSKIWAQEII